MRRRILAVVIGMTTLVVLAFAIPLVLLIRHNAYNDGLRALGSEARDIAGYLRAVNGGRTPAQISAHLAELDGSRRASVTLPDGTTLGTAPPGGITALPAVPSPGGFGARPSTGPSTPAPGSTSGDGGAGSPAGSGQGDGEHGAPFGFSRDVPPQDWRGGKLVQLQIPTIGRETSDGGTGGGSPRLYTIRVWTDDGRLYSGGNGQLVLIVGVAVALIVLGVVAGEVITRRIVRPLVDTAETAQRLGSGDTTARAPTRGPREVADVGLALNRLADRIDQLIADERETVADLSHRLRTPLTALRLDAEALKDPADAERVGAHVSTLERMLTAVIRAARRPQREGRIPSCDATAVVGDRVQFWSALAEDQQRASTVSLPAQPLTVRAGEEDLAAAVDALVENVIAHTPEGAAFAVTLAATDSGARLTVSDDGPGLPEDAPVRGRSDRGSSGLGLDIARRCAESSGGSLTLGRSASGGALVTLDLHRP